MTLYTGIATIAAIIAHLKMIAEIRQEPRLTDNGQSEFKVRMGFGLHAGWAIEGAVGSLQKVDATYLSPHVNMAARLETSSKQYGVPLLASQDFYDLLSNAVQAKCRRLDVVTVKGSEMPIGIYTYDALQDQEFAREERGRKRRPSVDSVHDANNNNKEKGGNRGSFTSLGIPSRDSNPSAPAITAAALAHVEKERAKEKEREKEKEKEKEGLASLQAQSSPQRRPSLASVQTDKSGKAVVFLTPNDETHAVLENDYDLLTLRQHVTEEFLEVFKEGVTHYLAGEWKEAKTLLESADKLMFEAAPALGGDGPSKTLLNYMQERNFEAPKSWKGYRPLTSK